MSRTRRVGSSGPRFGRTWLGLIVGVALLPSVGRAQTVEWAHSAGGTAPDERSRIAVDAVGNSYITGVYTGTANFGSLTLTSAGNRDIFVAKYDTGGNVLWAQSAGGTSQDLGHAIAVDAAGNSYVTGMFSGTATFGSCGSCTIISAGSFDIFVAKYDGSGNVLWVRSAGGPEREDAGLTIAVDAAGNSYVTGQFAGIATFDSFTFTSAGLGDIFVAKYDASGSLLWAWSAGGTDLDQATGIAVDATGNGYLSGKYTGTVTLGSDTLVSGGNREIFVARFDSDGNVLWARSAVGTSTHDSEHMAIDDTGNSYVTGSYFGAVTFGALPPLTSAGVEDIFVAKYDANGKVVWARSAGGTSYDAPTRIAADAAGNSYVTGSYSETATFGPCDSCTLISAGNRDVFVAKYDSTGTVVWARSAGGTSLDLGQGIGIDGGGNAYVTGRYVGPATFGSIMLPGTGTEDIFVAKYSPPAVCGNDVVEQGETCDDGFTDSCGGCNATCTGAGTGSACGDGVVCPETEVCDDGSTDACGTCNATCTGAGTGSLCGDGVLCPETEVCDDGFTDACGTCNANCTGPGTVPGTPAPDLVAAKNRYLSFSAGDPGQSQAVRISFVDIPPPNSSLNGSTAWVGAPELVSENGGLVEPDPEGRFPNFNAATLSCGPVFMDWSTAGTVHVSHRSIIPGGLYAVQVIDELCDATNEAGFSGALNLTQGVWGDLVGAFDSVNNVWTASDGVVEVISDVIAILDKFAGKVSAPIKARVDIEPATPDRIINISDATRAVDAFRGRAYPFDPGPPPCP